MRHHSRLLLTAVSVALVAGLLTVPAAASGGDAEHYDGVIDLTFPVPDLDERHFLDDYHDPRGAGRYHKATDIGSASAYGLEVHAAMGGEVVRMTGVEDDVPGYGYMLTVAGDDGRRYGYIHLGRQDGPPEEAYAPGLAPGDRVERGEHIGYVGHSGNASESYPHLHFEIADEQIVDPYGTHQRNPFHSLEAALNGGAASPRTSRVSFPDVPSSHTHHDAIIAIAEAGITKGCDTGGFCPGRTVTRGQMATFLQRALGLPATDRRPFDDVPETHAHAGAIAAVAEAGIARGDGAGRYRPDRPIDRGQMASFLQRSFLR